MGFNPVMVWLLKSPLHGYISNGAMLVSVTGRKSGRSISTPTNYLRNGGALWAISWRDRKWWRNLRWSAKARALPAGRSVEGSGHVIEQEQAVAHSLLDYYPNVPQHAKYVQIGLDAAGLPISADCERAAQKMVMVEIDL